MPYPMKTAGCSGPSSLTGPLGFLALEAGWTVTEVGRQPWVVYGLIRTGDAVTPVPGLGDPFACSASSTLGLGAVVAILLWRPSASAPAGACSGHEHGSCGAVMLAALILYVLFGGADFGGGVWHLLAQGPRAARQRALIEKAIAPIWEANHVWLILVVVVLFTGFPSAFAAISIRFHAPLLALLLAIVAPRLGVRVPLRLG